MGLSNARELIHNVTIIGLLQDSEVQYNENPNLIGMILSGSNMLNTNLPKLTDLLMLVGFYLLLKNRRTSEMWKFCFFKVKVIIRKRDSEIMHYNKIKMYIGKKKCWEIVILLYVNKHCHMKTAQVKP